MWVIAAMVEMSQVNTACRCALVPPIGSNLSLVPNSAASQPGHGAESGADTTVSTALPRGQSPNTRRAYDADWSRFVTWCGQHGHRPLPAEPAAVAHYLRDADAGNRAGQGAYAPATLLRWASAISDRHRRSSYSSPTASSVVAAAIADIRRNHGSAGVRAPRKAVPLMTSDVAAILAFARKETVGWASEVYERRDGALLLIGYAAALGRAELVGLTCADVRAHPGEGLRVRVRRAGGRGRVQPLPVADSHETCPPCAALRWSQVVAAFDSGGRRAVIRLLKTADPFTRHVCDAPRPRTTAESPYFRSIRQNGNLSATPLAGASVHHVIRRRAQRAGFDDEFVAALGVHSLRAGFITQAWSNGADAAAIVRHTGHAGPASLERYLLPNPDVANPAADLGL
jgi:site-specific recombinase XerD